MTDDTQELIEKMQNEKPIENPCPRMKDLGYDYKYVKGLVDKTDYYTRVEEDKITYQNGKYKIAFNLASKGMVVTDLSGSFKHYGKPTIFLNKNVIECIHEIYDKLGWND